MVGISLALTMASAGAPCTSFPPGAYYTRSIAGAPVDRYSRQYIDGAIAAGNTGGFWMAADPVEFVNLAVASTPMRSVRQKVPYHRFGSPYPWGDRFRIEPLSDAHAIVLRPSSCELFELYNAAYTAGVLSAYSGARWDLRRPFEPLPPGTPSAMSSGLSLYAGMVRWEEIAAGHIDHALNWAAPAGTVAAWEFVRPASDAEGLPFHGNARYRLPYGARLRLRASFDVRALGPQSRILARAMQRYGIYLADTARANELYDAVALDGSNRWNSADLSTLAAMKLSDFEVMPLPRVLRVPGH
jgi:hypothetical protein